jgi:hypothetical protein
MDSTDGDITSALSHEARKLYGAISGQDWELVDTLQAAHPNCRQELVTWGFISDENPPVARDPQQTLRTVVSDELEKALRHISLVMTMPDLSRDMIREYRQGQLRAGGSSVYLADPETVNRRLQDVIGDCRREMLCAQPGGPRKREVLESAVTRDSAALDRGVEIRTIYRDTVRDHLLTAEYARTMSTRPEGRPALYRTLPDGFERMVIVDRETAFISDHIVEGAPPHAAWVVTDAAVVAVLAKVFDDQWRRAQPWCGELRPRARAGVDTVSRADGVRTDSRQRAVLRYLCDGESQATTARLVGMSKRKMEEEIAALKGLFGAQTLAQLTCNFARSPDYVVDDSAPAETDGAPVTTAGAERAETAA